MLLGVEITRIRDDLWNRREDVRCVSDGAGIGFSAFSGDFHVELL